MIFWYNLMSAILWLTILIFPSYEILLSVQIFNFLDVIFSYLKYTPNKPLIAFTQFMARFMTIILSNKNEYILNVIYIWGFADLFRYLLYCFDIYLIRKLRYNIFWLMYPIGMILELSSFINYPRFSFTDFNIIRLFVICLYMSEFPKLYNHMVKQNRKNTIENVLSMMKGDLKVNFGKKQYSIKSIDECKNILYKFVENGCLKFSNIKDKLILKDLGLQVSWKFVFIMEYLVPIIISALFMKSSNHLFEYIIYTLIMLHYLKREFETFFIHKFSNSNMPFRNLFKNCTYYWLATFAICKSISVRQFEYLDSICIIIWLILQFLNFKCHKHLSDIRNGKEKYSLPTYLPFKIVACPNYTFEILGWVMLSFIVRTPEIIIFTILGTVQMTLWAKKKHKRNKELFSKNYTTKYRIFPLLY